MESVFSLGDTYFVAVDGNNSNNGSILHPWRTIEYALNNLTAGDTLEIRGGIYYEHNIVTSLQGTAAEPIIIESYQNEIAVLDGGIDTFLNAPVTKWTLVADSINLYKSSDVFSGSYVNAWLEDDNVHIITYDDSIRFVNLFHVKAR